MQRNRKRTHISRALALSAVVALVGSTLSISSAARAAECPALEAGDLFTVPAVSSAVYLVNENHERLYFPTSDVYHSWYSDFSAVVSMDQSCVSGYPAASQPPSVNYRPGSVLIKTPNDPSVFAVGPGNVRMKIASEAMAKALYGANWASLVRDVHESYWANYTEGDAIAEGYLHEGMLVKTSANGQVYRVEGLSLVPVTLRTNSKIAADVRLVSEDLTLPYLMVDDMSRSEAELLDATGMENEASEPVEEEHTSTDLTYTSNMFSFAFTYPMGWTVSETYSAESGILTVDLASDRKTDDMPAVDVVVEAIEQEEATTSEEYTDLLMDLFEAETKQVHAFAGISSGFYFERDMTDIPQETFEAGYQVAKDGTIYKISFRAKDDSYSGEWAEFEDMAASFHFTAE